MWLPILSHADGYGFTYGARVSFVGTLGTRSRLLVPLTWGGERRAALELERTLDGPVSILRGTLSANRRVNQHFELPDLRLGARVDAERIVTDWLRVGAGARVERVEFGPAYNARHTAGGVHATFDTRIDPSFPRNAIHARLGWERIGFEVGDAARWMTDAADTSASADPPCSRCAASSHARMRRCHLLNGASSAAAAHSVGTRPATVRATTWPPYRRKSATR
jgi:hypothetical protein